MGFPSSTQKKQLHHQKSSYKDGIGWRRHRHSTLVDVSRRFGDGDMGAGSSLASLQFSLGKVDLESRSNLRKRPD